jgi:hypothetical protein
MKKKSYFSSLFRFQGYVHYFAILISIVSMVASFEIKALRERLLVREIEKWVENNCFPNGTATCEDYVRCCKKNPYIDACSSAHGIVKHPVCIYDRSENVIHSGQSACDCIKIFIMHNYEDQCQEPEVRSNCEKFVRCCKFADGGQCAKYIGGELEYPACHSLKYVRFNDTEAKCQCATDTSTPALRIEKTEMQEEPTLAAEKTTDVSDEMVEKEPMQGNEENKSTRASEKNTKMITTPFIKIRDGMSISTNGACTFSHDTEFMLLLFVHWIILFGE